MDAANLPDLPFPDPLGKLPLPEPIEEASFDPTPPGTGEPPARRWWGRHLSEVRWQAELARLLVDPVYWGEGVPRGDGEPVVLIPGFLAGDASLSVMRGWLERMGYDARPSGILANVDCSDRALDRLDGLVGRIHRATGRRVTLVGHSRGGHFAKALSRRHPDRIAAAVSMGAGLDRPFDISVPTKAAVAGFRAVYARTTDRVARNGCFTDTCRCRFSTDYAGEFPAEVPLTSIYTRGDGVVRWEACVVPYATCVEVTGSHVGLAFNRKVYRALATALAGGRSRAR
ncbi:MAG TPA: alpha/beta fold hydrolase [Solirubrobacteraceae bacterium]